MIKMKCSLAIVFFLLAGIASAQQKKVQVKGMVIFTSTYKGGARPTQEIIEQCCIPKPYINQTLYLKKNYYSPVLYKIKTDANGNFKKCIRPGEYNVYINNEVDPEKAASFTSDNASVTDPYFVLRIDRDGSREYKIEVEERLNLSEIPRP